jgi:tetratricopeptide (TPR) repeat protein
MLGTPAYMAPEQFAMSPTDARTDQFSFCVALYECLHGQRPFAGETFLALMTSVTTGAPRVPPAKPQVPGWMRKVVLRGLETDPDRRYPSMGALLTALETDPTVRTKRLALGVGLLACLGLAAFGARRAVGSHQSMCRGADARWAGIWEANGAPSARKDAIRRAFAGTDKSYAQQAFAGASRLLDDYVRKWLAAYTETCEATRVRGEQSAEVLDLRMTCLQQHLGGVAALSDLMAHADGTVVENAVAAASDLPHLERCSDVASLRAVVKPPESEAVRKRVDGQRAEIARLVALRMAGHCNDAEVLAQDLLPRVRATGYLPLLAEALTAAGLLADQCVEAHVGIGLLKEGYTTAVAARDDAIAAEAAIHDSGIIADRVGDVVAGRDWLNIARATLQRFDNHAVLDAWLLNAEGIVLMNEGHGDEAALVLAKARDAKIKLFGRDSPDPIMSANNLGNALKTAGRPDEAIVVFTQTKSDLVRLLGDEHPLVAMVSNNLGESLNAVHRYGEAFAQYGRAIDLWRKAGAHTFLQYGLAGLGIALLGERRPAEAVEPLEEALAMRLETKADPAHLGETRFALARALWARPATWQRALALARAARDDYAQVKTDAATVTTIDAWLAAPAANR